MSPNEYVYRIGIINQNITSSERHDNILLDYKLLKNKMKTITLENGQKVEISEESYNALAKAVKEETWEEIYNEYLNENNNLHSVNTVEVKISAIKKLLITAKYLNGDWKPDWNNGNIEKHGISLLNSAVYISMEQERRAVCYFKTQELAQRAIDILGEDTIRTALGDY